MFKTLFAILFASVASLAAAQQQVNLRFDARVGNEPLACGRAYMTADTPFQVQDFRLYVHDVALLREDGSAVPVLLAQDGRWQRDRVALLDFEDKSGECGNGTVDTRKAVSGSVPAGKFTGVRFTLGVPFEQNHQDATIAHAPFNLSALFWNWRGGYKFARIDLATRTADGRPHAFPIHLGSTQCMPAGMAGGMAPAGGHGAHGGGHGGGAGMNVPPASCANPNRVTVELRDFDVARDIVVADLAALLAGTNIRVNHGEAPGCMSAPNDNDCIAIMKNLGIPYRGVTGEQRFFRAARAN
ncbi:MAG: metallo-mystery pair system four-Cys motif protein [Burkholderiales bacterium]|nr:metallo-mystery pair system four-Cys motif protein [Burkholderiales bacterium]